MTNYSRLIDENEEKQSLCLKRGAFFSDFKKDFEEIHRAFALTMMSRVGYHHSSLGMSQNDERLAQSASLLSRFMDDMEERELDNLREKHRLEDEDEALHASWRADNGQ